MTQKFKCPECETEMNLSEDNHTCPECEKSLTLEEAATMFEDGKIVAIVEDADALDEAKKKKMEEKGEGDDDEGDDEGDDDEGEGEGDDDDKPVKENIDYTVDVSEHVEALVSGEDLSEDFQKKAATIFESAVNSKIAEISKKMKANNEIDLAEARIKVESDLSETVNDYLKYVVEQWMEENTVAIEAGLRTEVTEDFIDGMLGLFKESYIEVPEDRYDVVEELAAKVEELESQLDEQTDKNIKLNKGLDEQKAEAVAATVSEGLAETDKEKFTSLIESVEFEDEEQYTEKLNTLKESYFKKSDGDKTPEELKEEKIDGVDDEGVDDLVQAALKHLRTQN